MPRFYLVHPLVEATHSSVHLPLWTSASDRDATRNVVLVVVGGRADDSGTGDSVSARRRQDVSCRDTARDAEGLRIKDVAAVMRVAHVWKDSTCWP